MGKLVIRLGGPPKGKESMSPEDDMDPDEEEEGDELSSEAGEMAAEKVLSAIKSGSAASLLKAMRSLMSYC